MSSLEEFACLLASSPVVSRLLLEDKFPPTTAKWGEFNHSWHLARDFPQPSCPSSWLDWEQDPSLGSGNRSHHDHVMVRRRVYIPIVLLSASALSPYWYIMEQSESAWTSRGFAQKCLFCPLCSASHSSVHSTGVSGRWLWLAG